MNRRSRVATALGAAALLLGLLLHQSMLSVDSAVLPASPALPQLKDSLLDAGGLKPLHHQVYHDVGEVRWEREVKPRILSEFVRRTAIDQGTLMPDAFDVLRWVRVHPEEAEAVLRGAR